MALLSRTMETETTVDAMHAMATVTLGLLGISSFSATFISTSSVFASPFIQDYAVCVRFYVVRAVGMAILARILKLYREQTRCGACAVS